MSGLEAGAQDLIDLSVDSVTAEKELGAAKDKMIRDVVEKTTVKYIKELIGETKFEKNRGLVSSKILRNSNRFIPLVRTTEPAQDANGNYTSTVTMKFSVKDLRQLLLKEGLLHLAEGSPLSIPFISIVDRANAKSYRWWIDGATPSFLQDQHSRLISILRTQLGKKGFYVVDPVGSSLRELVPSPFRGEGFRTEDLLMLGEFFKGEVMIEGKVVLDRAEGSSSRMTVEIQAVQVSNGRQVSELTRVFQLKAPPTESALQKALTTHLSEVGEEFAGQILDVWQKGILGASYLKLALRGNLSFQEIEKFKAEAMRVSDIKVIRERSFAPQEVVFECEVTGGASQVADKLKSVRPSWSVQVASTDSIVIRGP
ncbi:MAG TPA: hypothetical protein VFV50_01345 [Bdellovibrionales bacterium]|nr:hypothetical protein [Bdellovibrionales bacterium]